MIDNIHWLGHDTFRIDGSSTVYIDPWKLPAGAPPADSSWSPTTTTTTSAPPTSPRRHAADDAHRAGVGDRAVDGVATLTLSAGETATVGGVTVTAVPAYNIDKFRAPGELFHPRAPAGSATSSSSTAGASTTPATPTRSPRCASVRCDVALLPVSGTYVMTAEEAAEACGMISAAAVVPMHFGDIVGTGADAGPLRGPLRRAP